MLKQFNNMVCFIFRCLFGSGLQGQQPDTPLSGRFHPCLGVSKMIPSQLRDIISPVCPWSVLGSPGHAKNTSSGSLPGGNLTGCLNHIHWLLSMRRSSGSTLSFSGMSKPLTLTLNLSSGSSFLDASHPSASWRSLFNEANRTMSSAYSRDKIWTTEFHSHQGLALPRNSVQQNRIWRSDFPPTCSGQSNLFRLRTNGLSF